MLLLQVDMLDTELMNAMMNYVGDFDNKLKKFDAKQDIKIADESKVKELKL